MYLNKKKHRGAAIKAKILKSNITVVVKYNYNIEINRKHNEEIN
jgi:hypothetical protein